MTLDPLTWTPIGRRISDWKTDMVRAKDPTGAEWTVDPDVERVSRMNGIKFRAPLPEGHTYKTWFDEFHSRDPQFETRQDFIDHASITGHDLGQALNQELALRFVEYARRGTEGFPDASAILLEVFRPYPEVGPETFRLELDEGTMIVHLSTAPETGLVCRYDPRNSKYSPALLVLQGEHYSYDNTLLIPTVWPKGCDVAKVGARFVVDELVPWVRDNRMSFR